MEKSYNQRWKESGTTLTYKEWRRREDDKMASFNGIPRPSDSLKNDPSYQNTQKTITKESGYQTDISDDTIFGINKYVVYMGGLLIVGAIAYKIYAKKK
tara:strand:+ start:1039 stop:1335 length:297 start_codon:yes stop_codon:yes gene_type:complete